MLPIIFLCLLGFEFYHKKKILYDFSKLQVSILVNIILLNVTHNIFTFIFLLATQDVKGWIKINGGIKFWKRVSVLFVILISFFLIILYYSKNNPIYLLLFTLINFSFAAHHALSQIFGLSLIYNKNLNVKNKIFIKVERLIYHSFLVINLIAGNLFFIASSKMTFFDMNNYQKMHFYFYTFLLGNAFVLIIFPLILDLRNGLNKAIFNIRYIFWPFSLLSSFAAFATMALHGIEYAFVIGKLTHLSKLIRPLFSLFLIFLVIVFGVVRIKGLQSIYGNGRITSIFLVVTAISVAFSFLHYYLDRKLFRMSKEENRAFLGEMLSRKI